MLNKVYLPKKVQCERDRSKFSPEYEMDLSIKCPRCSRVYLFDGLENKWTSDRDLLIIETGPITWQ